MDEVQLHPHGGHGTAVREEDEPLRLRHHCGICNVVLEPEDKCRALIGTADSTRLAIVTESFQYANYDKVGRDLGSSYPCPDLWCVYCDQAPEGVPLHQDCFLLFRQQCKAETAKAGAGGEPSVGAMGRCLDLLWHHGISRRPWRGAPSLLLAEDYLPSLHTATCDALTVACHLPQLLAMPAEVARLICNRGRDALFWRFITAIDLANNIVSGMSSTARSAPAAPSVVRVTDIASWRRGRPLQLLRSASADDAMPVVRLTMDSHGIVSVERVAESQHSAASGTKRSTHNQRFVVRHHAYFADVLAILQNDSMRLRLPESRRRLQIWNTPTPPASPHQDGIAHHHWYSVGSEPQAGDQLNTIDLTRVTGLTFFIIRKSVFSIHGHTDAAPDATRPPFHPRHRIPLIAVYVPVHADDPIVAMEIRRGKDGATQIIIKTEGSGVTNVGTVIDAKDEGRSTGHVDRPTRLVYARDEAKTARMLGLYSETGLVPDRPIAETSLDRPPPRGRKWVVPFEEKDRHFASAGLDDVRRATVFFEPPNPESANPVDDICAGVLFEYANGSTRAVGQCRPDATTRCEHFDWPRHICISHLAPVKKPLHPRECNLYPTKVSFFDPNECDKHLRLWCCFPVKGSVLHYWFSSESSMLQVFRADADDGDS